jgi:hypothetical protein
VILCHSANLVQLSHVLRDAAWAADDGYATSVFVSHAFLVSKVPEALKVGAGPCVREEPGELVTVSREMSSCWVSLTSSSAKSSRVQRARPSGGFEQAVATSRASSLPESLRAAPGRGSSRNAASRLPSTKRRLVR